MAYRKKLAPPPKYADEPTWKGNSYDVGSRIVRAAWNMLFTKDPATISLREVAHEVGVSAPATYNHFKVRDQLFGELAEGGLWMLTNDFLALIPDDADVIPKGLVPDICKVWMAFAAKRPRHYALMFSLEFNDPGRHPKAADRRSKLSALLRTVVTQELGFVPSAAEGDLFLTMLHGAASLLASGDPRPPTKLIAQAITRQLATLKKQRQRPAPSRRGPASA